MSTLTETVRKHHQSLARTLEAHTRGAGRNEVQIEHDAFVAFLKGDLMPHACSEERHLYPLVDELVRNHGRATATMRVDHEFIADYVSRIEQTTSELATTMDVQRRERLAQSLHDLALQLDAIVKLHLAKEERVYLPLIAEHVDETRQRNVLHAVHESYESGKNGSAADRRVDVRDVIPRERHALIFNTFADLKPGEAFVLINDHDPRPLYYQFQVEHTGQFTWDYLEQGPEVWRVRVARTA
jgi:uncharacterized protein (DUF2249 family)/iron-sulfur cluster repair protein YtfE (RIC family)